MNRTAPITRCSLAWLLVLLLASTCQTAPVQQRGQPVAPIRPQFTQDIGFYHDTNSNNSNSNKPPGGAKRAPGRIFVMDRKTGRATPLLPGLLDETLLRRGSFSFGAKQVVFDKLKVLGNVYVKNVNGKPLNEAYVFKSRREATN